MSEQDILDKLKTDIANFPSNPSDQNIITSVITTEYNNYKKLLDVSYRPSSLIMTNVTTAVGLLTNDTYETIIRKFASLISITKNVTKFGYKINAAVDTTDDMTQEEQVRFMTSIPESVFNIIQVMKYYKPEDDIDMPASMALSMDKSLKVVKDDALKGMMGDLYLTILFPLIEYQDYLDSNEIRTMIDKLANIEMYLIPKYLPPTNFMNEDYILYSKYYANKYVIDSEGKLQVSKLSTDNDIISKLHNIVENIKVYYE